MPYFRPYAAATVRKLPTPSRAERLRVLDAAGHNPFKIRAAEVSIDLLSDSGTAALSIEQKSWEALADERYAGAESYERFEHAVRDLIPYPHVLPVHQGRAGERILDTALLSPGQISVSNTHFDTTRANVEIPGSRAVDLPCKEASDLDSAEPFKGNIDLVALEKLLSDGHVGQILMTITNNGGGGQPVSMANLEAVSDLARKHAVPFILDAARFAENAWLVTRREPGYENWSPREVARRAFDLADGCVISLKKDGLGHGGGLIALRDATVAERCEINVIATEGYTTYGGMTGHTLETLAQGLREVLDPDYLADREHEAAALAQYAHDAGVDTVRPAGMHAIYLNAGRLLPHLSPAQFPGHALACALYREGGIRAAELGSLYLGTFDAQFNLISPAPYELVRLALPRRVYDHSHLQYIGDVLAEIAKDPEQVPGYRIVDAPPVLRHFKCVTAPLG